MKICSTFSILACLAVLLSSCKTSDTGSSPHDTYSPQAGADDATNPYGAYPSYGPPPQNSYPNDGDYVDVTPIANEPQPQEAYTYQPPSYGDTASYQPQPAPAYSSGTTASAGSYHVVKGDTLYSISKRHRTTVEAIKAANGLSGDLIYEGDVLNIPPS